MRHLRNHRVANRDGTHARRRAIGDQYLSAGGNGVPHPVATVKLGTKWSYSIDLNGSHDLAVTINGSTTHFTEPSSFDGYKMYFGPNDASR